MFTTFIFVFENGQNLFSCGPPFRSFWSVKFLNFDQKLPISTAYHTIEIRHPEVNKNPYYVLSPKGSQKKPSVHGLVRKYNFSNFFNVQTKCNIWGLKGEMKSSFSHWKWLN